MSNVPTQVRAVVATVCIGGIAIAVAIGAVIPGAATILTANRYSDSVGTLRGLAQRSTISLILAAVLLVGVGLLAVGASGAIAGAGRAAWGDRFVAGNAPDVRDTASRCADLREYAPAATSCVDAAASHHSDEVVGYRIGAGVLGAVVLAAWALARRRDRGTTLPPTLVPAIGATAFGGVAAALSVEGIDALVRYGAEAGAGQWLSGAIVAWAVAASFAGKLINETAIGAAV